MAIAILPGSISSSRYCRNSRSDAAYLRGLPVSSYAVETMVLDGEQRGNYDFCCLPARFRIAVTDLQSWLFLVSGG